MFMDKARLLPLILTGITLLVDQCSKAFIVAKWPVNTIIMDAFNNDFLKIYHVRNNAMAFSLGKGVPDNYKLVFFIALPLLVLGFLAWYYFSSNNFSRFQRWVVAGIIGGGMGNIIDRIFRPDGVVDFISFKFYGLFGFDRWPTFNFADTSVVICSLLLLADIILNKREKEEM